ncbi:MAG: hypothetical protein IT384_16810 [Deltaproteobacteria bacterium]|nr:hypothetical protein [Deltaproteobacteria bacterium]
MAEPSHPTRFTLLRLLTGELSNEHAQPIRDHLTECERCAAKIEEARSIQEHARVDAPSFARIQEAAKQRPALRWLGGLDRRSPWLLSSTAAAALVLFFVLGPSQPEIHRKGGWLLRLACREGDRTWSCKNGERLHPGVAVMLEGDLPAAAELMLLVRGSGEAWAPQLPADGTRSVRVEGGQRTLLPNSLVLDDRGTEDQILLLSSRHPFDLSDLASYLASDPLDAERLPNGIEGRLIFFPKDQELSQ